MTHLEARPRERTRTADSATVLRSLAPAAPDHHADHQRHLRLAAEHGSCHLGGLVSRSDRWRAWRTSRRMCVIHGAALPSSAVPRAHARHRVLGPPACPSTRIRTVLSPRAPFRGAEDRGGRRGSAEPHDEHARGRWPCRGRSASLSACTKLQRAHPGGRRVPAPGRIDVPPPAPGGAGNGLGAREGDRVVDLGGDRRRQWAGPGPASLTEAPAPQITAGYRASVGIARPCHAANLAGRAIAEGAGSFVWGRSARATDRSPASTNTGPRPAARMSSTALAGPAHARTVRRRCRSPCRGGPRH